MTENTHNRLGADAVTGLVAGLRAQLDEFQQRADVVALMKPGSYGSGSMELARYEAYLNSAAHHNQILRWVRYGRWVLPTHVEDPDTGGCAVCLEDCAHGSAPFPCNEVRALAIALGVGVGDG